MDRMSASNEPLPLFHIVPWDKKEPITQEEAEARLHIEGYVSYLWHDVTGVTYPTHQHERDECIWILKGEIQFTLKEPDHSQVVTLHPGDRIYLSARLKHSAFVPHKNGVHFLVGQRHKDTHGK
jgi:mannose-6-phosphate isomerase-like protein (cupin superfamily)